MNPLRTILSVLTLAPILGASGVLAAPTPVLTSPVSSRYELVQERKEPAKERKDSAEERKSSVDKKDSSEDRKDSSEQGTWGAWLEKKKDDAGNWIDHQAERAKSLLKDN